MDTMSEKSDSMRHAAGLTAWDTIYPASDLANWLTCQHHGHAVNAHSPTARGWQTVFQSCAEGFIHEHGLIIACSTEPNSVWS